MRSLKLLGCTAALLVTAPAYPQPTPVSPNPPSAIAKRVVVDDDPNPVDPLAVTALRQMSDFLTKLNTFRLTSVATLDVVTVEDQRLQIDAVVKYKARRPNGLMIDFQNDLKPRQYYYDGKTFTIFAPKLGFYANTTAPPTIKAFLEEVYKKTGISLPLEDLFRWNDGDESDIQKLTSAFNVGTATIDGVSTDHWAFRQKDFDWELWIQKGDQPLPKKLVIIDRTDPSHPGFSARLSWELNPALADSEFTYVPGVDAKRIHLATLEEPKK